jgi:hypothetical protein
MIIIIRTAVEVLFGKLIPSAFCSAKAGTDRWD